MDDETLYERMLDSMEVAYATPPELAMTFPGVTASLCPTMPSHSVFNGVVYRDADALEAALPELARRYEEAGVLAWTVWTPERDTSARRVLDAAGHRLDATPQAMAAPLDEIDMGDGAAGLDWERADGVEEMCAVLEPSFGWDARPTIEVLDGLEDLGEIYLARVDGTAAACVATMDVEGDCGVYYVATVPEARGKGLSTGLLRQALIDGRERGCTTTSLQATAMGRPVYRRVGFRDLGVIEMWERRRS